MQATYEEMAWTKSGDDLAPEETRDIPFFGFVTGTVISVAMWGVIAWTLWAIVD